MMPCAFKPLSKRWVVITTQHAMLQVSRPVPTGNVVLLTDGGGPPATIQMPYNQTTCNVRSASCSGWALLLISESNNKMLSTLHHLEKSTETELST